MCESADGQSAIGEVEKPQIRERVYLCERLRSLNRVPCSRFLAPTANCSRRRLRH